MIGSQENIISNVSLDKLEVLRYLGHNGQEIDSDLNLRINECIKETKKEIDTKYIYEIYDIKNDLDLNTIEFKNTNLILKSKDVSELLKDCDKCVLMCATLGFNIEKIYEDIAVNDIHKRNYSRCMCYDFN